jgi:hypothetical protein
MYFIPINFLTSCFQWNISGGAFKSSLYQYHKCDTFRSRENCCCQNGTFSIHKHSKEIIRNESYHYNSMHIHKLDKYTHSMKRHSKYWLILSSSPGITPTSMQNFTEKHTAFTCAFMTLLALILFRYDILNQTVTIKKTCQTFILHSFSVYTLKLEFKKDIRVLVFLCSIYNILHVSE